MFWLIADLMANWYKVVKSVPPQWR